MRTIESIHAFAGVKPVDLSTAATQSDWINVANYPHLAYIFQKIVGTGGQDLTMTLRQATSAAGAGAKDLNLQRYCTKIGADLFAVQQPTHFTQDAATITVLGATEALIIVEIPVESLDFAGGFKYVSFTTTDPGAATGVLGYGLFIGLDGRYQGQSPPQAIL